MSQELFLLCLTAASIGFVHTILGPDHYLPFIVMSKAGKWSLKKTIWITIVSGIGHVGSSVVLGFAGIILGVAVTKLVHLESIRGELAGWLLIAFGFAYSIYGIKQIIRNKPHQHIHVHDDGTIHTHTHTHHQEHIHVHEDEEKKSLTPWIIFTIFVFGPCEPLIPILMYPAARDSIWSTVIVSVVFGLITIGTMLTVVILAVKGIELFNLNRYERYTHFAAGVMVLLSGIAIQFLGL